MVRVRRFLFFKSTAVYGALMILTLSLMPAKAEAGFIPSSDTLSRQRVTDLDKIRTVLESKMVAQRLGELGYTSEETTERLARLPDQELHRLAMNLDSLQSGGADFALILIVFVVIPLLAVLIIELSGHQVIPRNGGHR